MKPTGLPWPRIGAGALIAAILAAVGGPAAVASYRHAWTVADRYGTDPTMNPWLPLTTDGMIVAALTVLVIRRWRRVHVGAWPIIWALLGFAATLAANLAAVSTGRWIGEIAVPVVAVWPPIAFAVTLELVVTLLRPSVSTTSWLRRWWARTSDPATTFVQHRSGFRVPADTPAVAVHVDRAAHALTEDTATPGRPHDWDDPQPPAVAPIRDNRITDDDRRIIDQVGQRLTADPDLEIPTSRAIRAEFNLGKPRADRIHRHLTGTLETVT